MTPYDRAWDMGSYTEYMWSYDGICQGVRIPDAGTASAKCTRKLRVLLWAEKLESGGRPGPGPAVCIHDNAGLSRCSELVMRVVLVRNAGPLAPCNL